MLLERENAPLMKYINQIFAVLTVMISRQANSISSTAKSTYTLQESPLQHSSLLFKSYNAFRYSLITFGQHVMHETIS